uniref:Uncharacterized protein n=1 Tax=Sphaerodactylus townsendi TaxID=933632 RepID=A0ACB8EYN5_9SAUR
MSMIAFISFSSSLAAGKFFHMGVHKTINISPFYINLQAVITIQSNIRPQTGGFLLDIIFGRWLLYGSTIPVGELYPSSFTQVQAILPGRVVSDCCVCQSANYTA